MNSFLKQKHLKEAKRLLFSFSLLICTPTVIFGGHLMAFVAVAVVDDVAAHVASVAAAAAVAEMSAIVHLFGFWRFANAAPPALTGDFSTRFDTPPKL